MFAAIHIPKALTTLTVSLLLVVAALPALAQEQYAYVALGWNPVVIIIGLIIVLLAIIGVMVIFVWLVRWATRGYPFYDQSGRRGHAALDILDERFAKGEIDKAEYEEKRKLLGR